jgi:hypothetical protein
MKMKKSQLKEVIKAIVKQALKEGFQVGEWWIDDHGSAQYCDGDVGDVNHEAYIRQILAQEVMEHFGVQSDGDGGIEEHEGEIKQELYDDGKLSEEELAAWDNDPANVMLNKLEQDNPFGADKDRLHWWFFLAYGSQTTQRGDARDYAMKYMGYKRMVTRANKAIVQTHTLTPNDLKIIDQGLSSVWEEDYDGDDAEVEEDGYSGPRVEIEVRATNQTFHNVPVAVIEKHSSTALRAYLKYLPWMGEQISLNEGYFRENKSWSVYEGSSHVIAMFEDNSRQSFEICFHNMMGEDKERWRHRAASKWSSIARKLHGDVQLSEVGNPIERSWQECFKEALQSPELKEFIRNPKHKKVFDDVGYPKKMAKKAATVMDPVNFTKG